MTEYTDKLMEESASRFMVFTCLLLPLENSFALDCTHIPLAAPSTVPRRYSIACGSVAEFYIRPLNPCISDTDILFYHTDQLAFVEDFPVLPNDVSGLIDTIECIKIEPYLGYPGFIRLRLLGEMNYNWKQKKYIFFSNATSEEIYLNQHKVGGQSKLAVFYKTFSRVFQIVRGPATTHQYGSATGDAVECLWSPQWPKEAQRWLTRPRNNGWPTTATISVIAERGCHVVYAQHHACRNDELQWRFSFSVAEVILLHSWTQIQQIVYHFLRFFAKRELIHKDCPKEDEVLCNYHFKTLMLWTCEEMSLEWWKSSSAIAICCELLKKLLEWLKKRNCPNYFIPEANLFPEPMNPTILDKTERRLHEFCNSSILCRWFVKHYIQPIKFEVITNEIPDVMFFALVFFKIQKAMKPFTLDLLFSFRFAISNIFAHCVIKRGLTSGLCSYSNVRHDAKTLVLKLGIHMTTLPITHHVLCLTYQDATLYMLDTAYYLGNGEISYDGTLFFESVKGNLIQHNILRSQYHNFPKTVTAERSRLQFLRAQDLMLNLTGSNSPAEFQLLSILSKEFLRKALECEDSNFEGIAPAALIYLAAFHFATSEFQTAIDRCSAVLMNQMSQKENETLNAGCLFFIDDVIRIVGFCLLFKKIKDNICYINRHVYLDLRLTPHVFAYHLAIISNERISRQLNIVLPRTAFSFDEFLLVLTKRKYVIPMNTGVSFSETRQCVYRRPDSLTENENFIENLFQIKNRIIDLLLKCALENMTLFYTKIRKDFGIQCNTDDCYRALYLYKCRQYTEVLNLCEEILNEPDLQNDLQEFAFVNVSVLPPLDSYFDGDVQSLLGFHTLFCYLSPANGTLVKLKLTRETTFAHYFAREIYSRNYVLSASLRYSYCIKCHYFLGRHFLARYLKLRCSIDCKHPYTETMAAFAAMKSRLPFEHIIARFLQTKLRQIQI